MKRKIMYSTLCIVCLLMITIGVVWQSGKRDSKHPPESEAASVSESEDGVSHIVMTYLTLPDSRTDDLEQVVESINEISRSKIGVEIELLIVDAAESAEKFPLWITQGKQMDLMLINYQDITKYTKHKMLRPLDELLEKEGAGILEISDSYINLFSGTIVDETIYGVQIPYASRGDCGALWVPTRYLDEVNFHYDENQIYTLDDLDELFSKLKELHPESYPLGQIPTRYNFSTFSFFRGYQYDSLGASTSTGVLDTSINDTTLKEYYELDYYYEWLTYMRKWYLAGYIYPDAATTSLYNVDLLKEGITLSIPLAGMPYMFTKEQIGEEIVPLRLSDIIYEKQSSTGIFWTIPKTAKNPSAAMRFLNLLNTDSAIINLFSWGLEGKDYEMKSEDIIVYPDGKTQENVGYYNPLGVYGDMRKQYSLNSDEKKKGYEAFSALAIPVNMQYVNFSFDSTAVLAEMNQVNKVLDQYLDPLETGSVDLDQVYPEFIEKLHKAGIEKVIDEKQRQFDHWLDNNPNVQS